MNPQLNTPNRSLSATTRPSVGHCTLVGAGPGDPELLTIKALKAIQAASVMLVDDLVSPAIVDLARPGTRVVWVGKRGGCRSTPQAFIEKLIVTSVLEGEHVVRLKGGDPFVFGRGGEEVEHLRAAGIDVTVVNGITAGLAAVTSLGAPLTHRDHAQGVIFLTGHAQPGSQGTDWAALAHTARTQRLTLVIYMGTRTASAIEQALLQTLAPTTPVAIVQNASLPEQRHAVCRLDQLHATLVEQQLGSPSVIVIGDVLQGLFALQTTPAAGVASPQALRA